MMKTHEEESGKLNRYDIEDVERGSTFNQRN